MKTGDPPVFVNPGNACTARGEAALFEKRIGGAAASERHGEIMIKAIIFDLDGTLTDPALGITNSVMYALKKFGISVSDRSELFRFIGPPLMYSFKTYYGFDDEKAKLAIDYYRDRFADGGKFENEVYPGIAELLAELRSAGSRIILATSKPEEFSVEILEHFDLLKYFDFVA